jgi:ketol-acid reductoisomerase
MNLHDSRCDVVVGVRPDGPSAKRAASDGLTVATPADAVKGAELVAMLVPDMAQPALYREAVAPNLRDGATLLFAHGFNVHFRQIEPRKTIDVSMVAPKGPGALVRRQYEEGRGVPCLVAVHQDATGKAFDRALGYAHHIGGTRAGVIRTTFAEETETDLFGEQACLCGGATELVTACWETLVEAGYSPEVAYFECMHELKLIVDLMYEGGISKMLKFVSDTAKYGDLTRGPRVIDEHARANIRQILAEVKSGKFAEEWIAENAAGGKNYRAMLEKDMSHPIETVGRKLRERMAWLPKDGADAR